MAYDGGDSWASYGGMASVTNGGRLDRRNPRRGARRDRNRGEHRDYRNEYRVDDGGEYREHRGGRYGDRREDHRGEYRDNRGDRGDHRDYRDDHLGEHHDDRIDHADRAEGDHARRGSNRRNSDYLERGEGNRGGEKGQGKGNRAMDSWHDRHEQGTSNSSGFTAVPSAPVHPQPAIPQEYSPATTNVDPIIRDERQEYIQGPAVHSVSSRTPSLRQDPAGAELLRQAARSLEEGDLGGMSKVLLKLAKAENVGLRSDAKWKDILEQTNLLLKSATVALPNDLSDLVFAFGKLQLQDPCVMEVLKTIADMSKYRIENFTSKDMSGMVWGFASLGVRNESLMSVTAAEVVNKISDFDQRQLSNTAWAFAKCGLWNEQLVNAIASECLSKIGSFTAQSLSHISWAMAQWGTRREGLMDAISCEAQRKISDFAPPSLAMTAWSFASLQLKSIHLMSAISTEAQSKITHFKTQDLAHLAWAFANLRIQDVRLYTIMAEEILKNIKGTMPPELSNIAWAFSKNGLPNENLMMCIAQEAVLQIKQFKPAEIAMLTWAFAVAGLQNKELMTEIGAQIAKRIDRFSAPQLSHIAWAFGALSLRHSEFLKALSEHVTANKEAFKAQGLSNIAWAFAMVQFRDHDLLRRISPEIIRDVAELRPLALARCAWAYRVLSVESPDLMAAICTEATKKIDDFPYKALAKLVDSVYVVPQATSSLVLENALQDRTGAVIEFLSQIKNGGRLNEQDYSQGMQALGLMDAGFVGTPMLMKRLEVEMPSLEFIEKCRQQAQARRPLVTNELMELAAAQVDLSWRTRSGVMDIQWSWQDFIVVFSGGVRYDEQAQVHRKVVDRSSGELQEDTWWPLPALEPAQDNEGLIAVDLGGRSGKNEPAFIVLSEIHARLNKLALSGSENNESVIGCVQIFSSTLPSISVIGALRQFDVMFPGVTVEFAEQVGSMED